MGFIPKNQKKKKNTRKKRIYELSMIRKNKLTLVRVRESERERVSNIITIKTTTLTFNI